MYVYISFSCGIEGCSECANRIRIDWHWAWPWVRVILNNFPCYRLSDYLPHTIHQCTFSFSKCKLYRVYNIICRVDVYYLNIQATQVATSAVLSFYHRPCLCILRKGEWTTCLLMLSLWSNECQRIFFEEGQC